MTVHGYGRRGLAPLLLLLLLTCLPDAVRAHAALVESEPADGAVLQEPRARLRLRFDEPVKLLGLSLLDRQGVQRELTAAAVNDGQQIVVDLAEDLAQGGHLLSWRVSSLDGHVVSGTLGFSIGAAEAVGPAASADAWRWPAFAFRLAARLAMLLAAGSALFLLVVARPNPPAVLDRRTHTAAAVAFAIVLLAFGATGAERAGLPAPGLHLPAAWAAAFAAPAAWAWIACLAALAVLATVRQRTLRLAGAFLAPCLLATSGHALAAWPGVGQGLMWLHGLAAAAWIGALRPLHWALRHSAEAPRLFHRFQTLGLAAVATVVGSGVALGLAILPSVATLWSSAYGLRLSAKLLLVVAMLAIAALNRLHATRAAMAGGAAARALLSRLLALDALVAAGVVVLAAGLSLDPPPAPAAGLSLHLHQQRAAVALTLVPGRIGDNAAELRIVDAAGAPYEPREVTVKVAAPDAGVAAVTLKARSQGGGHYTVDRLPLWIAGPWEIEVGLLVDSFTIVKLRESFALAGNGPSP